MSPKHFSENKQLFEGNECRDGGRGGEHQQLKGRRGCIGKAGWVLLGVLVTSPSLTERTGLLTACTCRISVSLSRSVERFFSFLSLRDYLSKIGRITKLHALHSIFFYLTLFDFFFSPFPFGPEMIFYLC